MLIRKKFLIFLGCFLFIFFKASIGVSADATTQRLGGADRYETSVKISQNNWQKSEYVILTSGEDFPDALSAAPLSKKYDAPILLTGRNSISNSVLQEIGRLNARNAFIIGGTGVISENINKQLSNINVKYTRIYGQDRYETSVKVAELIGTNNGIFITSGENFPDGVSAAPIAAAKQMPILLTTQSTLPDSVKNFIEKNNVNMAYIVGGNGAVGNVNTNLKNNKRLSGTDRYATNSAVINEFTNTLSFNNVYLANGENFADALSGSAAAAKKSSPVVLVNNSYNTKNSIVKDKLNSIATISILGGTGVISDSLVRKIISSSSPIKVALDPGHGGYDSGAVGPTGVLEKDVNLAITLKVGKILQDNGIDVVYTRTSDNVSWPSDVGQDLQKRSDIANNEGVQYFVCVHANSADAPSANGTETYYMEGSTVGEKLAKSIQQELANALGLQDRGIKTAGYYVLKNTNAPAVLTEVAFISNPNEEKLLNSDSFQNKAAKAIATGILKVVNQ
ncbi:N-acetylmuramoyl-L-alanine amidase [Clostridium sp. P21]|uniref:N-acetylmuramoyl-L-alanine amidase n=1 Tax=Clostridium muellerianum TaxID=2716538 RepID=A0A7Y0EJS2_9CLOT|nr:cell wall-binding repeat-containing protein [Clostridium muellerianum]NMM64764.1 N-acetylmuramoyl-L-alanine amidase [Clostridium muellerianum]